MSGKDDGSASPHTMWEQWRIARMFRAYKRIAELEQRIVARRQRGREGILVDDDDMAQQYQQRVVWRKEVLEAAFEGRKPNPYLKSWYMPNDKAQLQSEAE